MDALKMLQLLPGGSVNRPAVLGEFKAVNSTDPHVIYAKKEELVTFLRMGAAGSKVMKIVLFGMAAICFLTIVGIPVGIVLVIGGLHVINKGKKKAARALQDVEDVYKDYCASLGVAAL